ncbi:MAG TPA: D-glycerate dehydrogenase [Bryobacteraceae bacterium]|nr:D-glycerate dehydrogenase [Bryobacteraceae bacterium]
MPDSDRRHIKVLITRRIYPEALQILRDYAEIDYNNSDERLTATDLLRRAGNAIAIMTPTTQQFNAELLGKLNSVRIIANIGVGFDNVDISAASRLGILVSNTPDVLTETTADFAFALLLATARRVVEANRYLVGGKWIRGSIDLLAGHDVHHRTLGIFGLGRIGAAMARRGNGFSMKIFYHDCNRANKALEEELGATFVSKEQLLRESDFISLHVPLSEASRRLIGEPELRQMKRTSILINTSRGAVVDEQSLIKAIQERWISGAGLDVFEHEPQVNPVVLNLDNVVVTPHIASSSEETRRKMCLLAAGNILSMLQGRRPEMLVNPQVWDSTRHSG